MLNVFLTSLNRNPWVWLDVKGVLKGRLPKTLKTAFICYLNYMGAIARAHKGVERRKSKDYHVVSIDLQNVEFVK